MGSNYLNRGVESHITLQAPRATEQKQKKQTQNHAGAG